MGREGVLVPGVTLLATKFSPPRRRQNHVRRDRLHLRMAGADSTPLTLVSAPAGFGKTALLAQWLSELPDGKGVWLSIDRRDNDPGRLWAHLIAAVQRLAGGVGEATLSELRRTGGRAPADGWLTMLINDLADSVAPESFLVLDDVHLLTDAELRAGICELAGHLPAWLHLVLSTRSDPPLPLPRLRVAGQLTEIRGADLRFVAAEAGELLAAFGMRDVDVDRVDSLVERTEGWAAGLQLACIVSGEHGPGVGIDDLVGSRRPFTDYLISEVVDAQPPEMRAFLFATSLLDRVSPALATAVSGRPDADHLLRQAEQRGLFLAALDGRDDWYRYHHLFAQALQHEFRVRFPEAADAANSAAAAWFEGHGDAETALEHWLAAGRPDEALRLAVQVGFTLVDRGQAATLERIARRIPATVPGDDPARQLDYGLIHIVFEPETFLAWVAEAAHAIAQQANLDDELLIRYLIVQAIADLIVGAWSDAVDRLGEAVARSRAAGGLPSPYSQRARLELIRAAGWLERVADAETAFRSYVADRRVPDESRLLVAPSSWALAAALSGRIDEADRWVQRVIANVELHGSHGVFAIQEMLLAQSIVARERGDVDTALESIDRIRCAGVDSYYSLRAMAEVEAGLTHMKAGRLDDAAAALHAARHARPGGDLDILVLGHVDSATSRLCLAVGDLPGAGQAAERMPSGLWRCVARARVLLAEGATTEVEAVLRHVSPNTPRQHVAVRVLRALGLVDHDTRAADDEIAAALQTAAAHGLLDAVITGGPGVAELVERASWAVPGTWMEAARRALAGSSAAAPARIHGLVEQPTAREREVLRLLASRLTIPEIARELGVSPNTLKSHIRALYRKLAVGTRQDAVNTARHVQILR